MKYNKNIKHIIDININDYKVYSSIEIEIKVNKRDGKFININKEDEEYYHIYFDNNKEEIKNNYLFRDSSVKLIKIIIDF